MYSTVNSVDINDVSVVTNDVAVYASTADLEDCSVYSIYNSAVGANEASRLPRAYTQVYDGTWKNGIFMGKTDFIWYITEEFEEYQGQWSHGRRTGQGVIRDITKVH